MKSWREVYPQYVCELNKRLVYGEKEYGNRNLNSPLTRLLGEYQEESLDMGGYGFLSYYDAEMRKNSAASLEALISEHENRLVELEERLANKIAAIEERLK